MFTIKNQSFKIAVAPALSGLREQTVQLRAATRAYSYLSVSAGFVNAARMVW